MPQRLAPPEQRRQTALLLGLSVAVVASLAFSEYLTRTVLGLAAFWPANALLAAGLVTLSGSRRLSLSIVFVVFHLCIDMLVGDSPARALLYTAVDTGEALTIWALCLRLWRGAPRIRSLRSLILLPAVTTPVAAAGGLIVAAVPPRRVNRCSSACCSSPAWPPAWPWPSRSACAACWCAASS
jgi:hypothetical protein